MKLVRLILALLAVGAVFVFGFGYGRWYSARPAAKAGRKVLYWVDPMHPAYKSDKPGIAPDCGMKLEPVYADGGAPSGAGRKVLYYRDPKDSNYKSQQPGLNPETGNELEPVYADDLSAMPAGTVEITPEKQQLIGVKYGEVEKSGGARTIRAVGKVAFDETRIQHVHTKVEGWVDRVFADYTGQLVRKGQPLLTIYSPDMLASQQELLLAAKANDVMRHSSMAESSFNSAALLRAARRRLQLWDLSDAQIDQVLKTGEPIKNVTLDSPDSGFITDRKAFPQLKVVPETELYTIVNLDRVWIVADVFEYEAPDIRIGETARISLQAVPGRTFPARVNYIQPQVDPTTRTLKVRLDMDNPSLTLKPDMYVNVDFNVNLPVQLAVPADAVLDAGERKTVFVDRGNGFFEPRQVTVGERDGDRIQILSGLSAGERVVTSGNFLIDSESQLKAAAAGMGGMAGVPAMTSEPIKQSRGQESKPADNARPAMPGTPETGGKKK